MTISVATHECLYNGVVTDFVTQKLLSPIWGNDHIVFWNNGHAVYYCSTDNTFCGLTGIVVSSYQMRLKPQPKPWAAKDAVEYLGGGIYKGPAYLGTFSKVTLSGIESPYGSWTYQEMLEKKMHIECYGKIIPAYNPAT